MSATSSTTKSWSIPDEMEPFISEKCPSGKYLVCSVCSVFDMDERGFGKVRLRNNYWLGYFKDHLNSVRHKQNCAKKAYHEEERKRMVEDGRSPPRKRKKQIVLPFATLNPSDSQVRDRIVSGVCPVVAAGSDTEVLNQYKSLTTKSNQPKFCNGVLGHKDLSNAEVQGGISTVMKYFASDVDEEGEYKFSTVRGMSNTVSLFCKTCTGGSETVK